MNLGVITVLTLIKYLCGQKILPSPPRIVYGGFVPMILDNQFSENINVEHQLRFDRKSKSLPLYGEQNNILQLQDKSDQNHGVFSSWIHTLIAGQKGLKFDQTESHLRSSHHVNSKPRFPLCKSSSSIISDIDDHLYILISSYTWETPVQTPRCNPRKSCPGQCSGSSVDFSQVFQFPAKSPEAPAVIRVRGSQETPAQTSYESRQFCDLTETWKAWRNLHSPPGPSDQTWRRLGFFQRRPGQFHSEPGHSHSTAAAR